MDKEEVIEKVKSYADLLKGKICFENIYLFGSYAGDSFSEDSDIDVAIIVEQADDDFFSVNPLLWKLRRQIDDRIEPVLIEKKYDDAGFFDEILKTGIKII